MKQELNKNNALVGEIKTLIDQSKQQVSVSVNATITMLYWQIGNRINSENLKDQRAEYGKQIVQTISAKLTAEYGPGWSEKQLRHCLRFAETITEKEIVYTLCRQLSWSHIRMVIFMEDPLKRQFYIEMCKVEKWNTRTLQEKINSMLYERTGKSGEGYGCVYEDEEVRYWGFDGGVTYRGIKY